MSKKILLPMLLLAALLAGCSDPKSTKLPPDVTQVDKVQPELAKLSAEDRKLFDDYVARYKAIGVFSNVSSGSKPPAFPAGATIGDALTEQRKIADAEAAAAAAAQKAQPAK